MMTAPDSREQPRPKSVGRIKVVAIVLAVIAIGAFSEVLSYLGPASTVPGPYTVTVIIPKGAATNASLNYSPSNITVVLGINNTVQWVNEDLTANTAHTITFTKVPANASAQALSSSISPGLRYGIYFGPILFSATGVYRYHCYYNAWMTGEIIVKP